MSDPERIILDTNVVSETFRSRPDPNVVAWFAAQKRHNMYLTIINEAELWVWVETQDKGKRRDYLFTSIHSLIEGYFSGRVLDFDKPAARMFATIFAERQAVGKTPPSADCQIAAIARLHNAVVATRDVKHFAGCGIEVVNPWVAGIRAG